MLETARKYFASDGVLGASAAIYASLCCAIGGVAALLSLALMMFSPGVPRAASLYWVRFSRPSDQARGLDPDSLQRLRSDPDLEAVGGYIPWSFRGSADSLGWGASDRFVRVAQVDPGMFRILGDRLLMGREFGRRDDSFFSDNYSTAILSWRLWSEMFAGDESVVGQTVRFRGWPYLNGVEIRIIGVLRKDAPFPDQPDMFIPLPRYNHQNIPRNAVSTLVRLRPGVRLQAAAVSIAKASGPGGNDNYRAQLVGFLPGFLGPAAGVLQALTIACGVLLLLLGFDVVALSLIRAEQRAGEMRTHVALGATPHALLGWHLRRAWVPALAAGSAAFAINELALNGMQRLAAKRLPGLVLNPGSLRVPAVCGAAVAIMVLAWYCLPVLWFSIQPVLGGPSYRRFGRFGTRGVRAVMTAMVLCAVSAGAGAMAATLLLGIRTQQAAMGVDTSNLYAVFATLPLNLSRSYTQLGSLLIAPEMSARQAGLPIEVGAAAFLPGQIGPVQGEVELVGSERAVGVNENGVTPGFFRTLGFTLESGRTFTSSEMADMVGNPPGQPIVIDDATAAALGFTPLSALGRLIHSPGDSGSARVVGVVSSAQIGVLNLPTVYVPMADIMPPNGAASVYLFVRGAFSQPKIASLLGAALAASPARGFRLGSINLYSSLLPLPYQASVLSSELAISIIAIALLSVLLVSFGTARLMVLEQHHSACIRVALGGHRMRIICSVVVWPVAWNLVACLLGAELARVALRSMSWPGPSGLGANAAFVAMAGAQAVAFALAATASLGRLADGEVSRGLREA